MTPEKMDISASRKMSALETFATVLQLVKDIDTDLIAVNHTNYNKMKKQIEKFQAILKDNNSK